MKLFQKNCLNISVGKAIGATTALMFLGGAALANQSLVGSGFGMTTGYVTNAYNLHSAAYNPAGLDFLVEPQSRKRFGLVLSNLGAQYEIGNVNGFKTSADRINELTSKTYNSVGEVTAAKTEVQQLVDGFEKEGRLSVGVNLNPLLTPVVWRVENLKGTVSLNFQVEAQLLTQFKSAAVTESGNTLKTNAGFDMHAAVLKHFSLGYATFPFSQLINPYEKWGRLDVGGRLNVYSATAMRDYKMTSSNDTANSSGLPESSSTQVGVDIGVMSSHRNGQIGLTVYNANSPKFNFPTLNSTNAVAQANAGKLSLSDSVTMKAHTVLEGSLFSESHVWVVQASHALNPTTNLVGEEKQYSTLSLGVYPKFESSIANFLTPTFRLGVRKNQVGSQLTTTSFGLSLFRVLNIDVWMSQEKAALDKGTSVPRSAGASIGFTSSF